jgi:hypothetical protein
MGTHRPFATVYPLRHVPSGPGSMSCWAAVGATTARAEGWVGSAAHAVAAMAMAMATSVTREKRIIVSSEWKEPYDCSPT